MKKLLLIALLTLGFIYADDGGSRDCSDYNNQYDCELAGCEWNGGFLNVCIGESEYVGDLNGDGMINILDIVQVVNLVLENEYEANGDLNSDGIINVIDIVQLVNIILN